jgi:hypothetical protein
LYKSVADWIAENGEHDWRANFGLKQCSYRLRPSRDNYTEIAFCQVGSVLP